MCVFGALSMSKNFLKSTTSAGHIFYFVYQTQFVRRVALLLLLSFLVQPVHRSYAEEIVVDPSSVPEKSDSISVPEPVTVEIPIPPTDAVDDVESQDTANEAVVEGDEADIVSSVEIGELVAEVDPSPAGDVVVTTPTERVSTTTFFEFGNESESQVEPSIPAGSDADEMAEDSNVLEDGSVGFEGVSNEQIEFEEASDTESLPGAIEGVAASSTDVDDEPILPLVHETFSGAEIRFDKSDCVQVDDGSFYCQPGASGEAVRDSLVALPDSDGDLEIFIVKGESYFQLTNNSVDDSAPYYDSVSKTVVWHRLLDDRYRIMAFDLESGEEFSLTDGEYNDMEPARHGDAIVWQRWVGDAWQVMLWQDGELTQLTEGVSHHLSPSVYDDLVLWRTVVDSGSKVLESFDIRTGRHTVIDDPEEAAMVNPRMVMVYEAVYENGDRVTRGVDITTGKIVSLGVLPVELPDELPDTDATGEVRALIQAKPGEQELPELDEAEPVPANDPPSVDGPLTLVLPSSTPGMANEGEPHPEVVASTSTAALAAVPDLVEFDLIIPPATSTQLVAE